MVEWGAASWGWHFQGGEDKDDIPGTSWHGMAWLTSESELGLGHAAGTRGNGGIGGLPSPLGAFWNVETWTSQKSDCRERVGDVRGEVIDISRTNEHSHMARELGCSP